MYEDIKIEAKFPENDIKYIEKKLKSIGFVNIKIKKKPETRTQSQHNSVFLYSEKYANSLNDAGFDVKKTLSKNVKLPWTKDFFREYVWKPIQKHHFGTTSIKSLKKVGQIDKIVDSINITIGERTGVSVAFPSREEVIYNQEAKNL